MAEEPFNRHGGLTLVPLPGYEGVAEQVRERIQRISSRKEKGRKWTPVDIARPSFETWVNGEPRPKITREHIAEHDCVVLAGGPGTYEMQMQLLYTLGLLAARRAARVRPVLHYFPLSRSDRDDGDNDEFALPKFVVNMMLQAATRGRTCTMDRIIVLDAHSEQIVMAGDPGLITAISLVRRVVQRAVEDAEGFDRPICLAFPDENAKKRFNKHREWVFQKIGRDLPWVCTPKDRFSDKESKVICAYGETDKVRDATVLCVDDEIATGGTNMNTAAHLKREHGAAEVWGVVTHGVLCGDAPEKLSAPDAPLDRLYVTGTVPIEPRRDRLGPLLEKGRLITDETWLDDVAHVIYRDHWGEDVRKTR